MRMSWPVQYRLMVHDALVHDRGIYALVEVVVRIHLVVVVLLLQLFHSFPVSIIYISIILIILLQVNCHLLRVFRSSLFYILFSLVVICLDVVALLLGFWRHFDVKHIILRVLHILIHIKKSHLIIFIVTHFLSSSHCFPFISTHIFNTSFIRIFLSKFILYFRLALNWRVAKRLILPTLILQLWRAPKLRRLFLSAVQVLHCFSFLRRFNQA